MAAKFSGWPQGLVGVMALLGLSLDSVKAGIVDPCQDPQGDLVECAKRIDSYSTSATPRPKILPDAYQSSFGTQIHPECFRIAEKEGLPREKAEPLAEKWIAASFRSILSDCRRKYPEAEKYFKEWVVQARRMVVTCIPNTSKKVAYGAKHLGMGLGISLSLPSASRKGLDFAPLEATSRKNKPAFVFPKDSWIAALHDQRPGSYAIDNFVHETFHATTANNQFFHNSLWDEGKNAVSCKKNFLDDRVYSLSYLCSGDHSQPKENGPFISELFHLRNQKCGIEKSCENTFTSRSGELISRYYETSEPISKSLAKSLCKRIDEDGQCRVSSRKEKERFLARFSAFTEIDQRLAKRLDEIAPTISNEIPPAVIEMLSPIKSWISSIKQTECYKQMFEPVQFGHGLQFKSKYSFRIPTAEKRLGYLRAVVSRFNEFADEMSSGQGKCANLPQAKKTADALRWAATMLKEALDPDRSLYWPIATAWAKNSKNLTSPHLDASWFINQPYQKMIWGEALFNDYIDTLRRYHPDSTHFDCVATGYNMNRTVELTELLKPTVETVNATSLSCP